MKKITAFILNLVMFIFWDLLPMYIIWAVLFAMFYFGGGQGEGAFTSAVTLATFFAIWGFDLWGALNTDC
ncbi:hypothetical protein SDC9_33605 [bioreactor metagenome]|uniref:Uncharacterized protein n=1 Tax=bioreactor metagenome TaxID=1076179 RepID=A0A644V8E3_9ZZZZ